MGWFDKITAPFGGSGGAATTFLMPGVQDTAGLFGLGAKVAPPDLEKAELDADARATLQDRNANFSKPAEEYEKQIVDDQNRGIESSGSLLGAGSVSSPMEAALKRRQDKEMNSQTHEMRRSDTADAKGIRGQRMASTMGALRNDSQNAINFAQKNKLAQQNKAFARNNAVNAVFKNVGTGIGAVIGGYFGGAEGAKAGGMAGQGAGNAASGYAAGPTGNLGYL